MDPDLDYCEMCGAEMGKFLKAKYCHECQSWIEKVNNGPPVEKDEEVSDHEVVRNQQPQAEKKIMAKKPAALAVMKRPAACTKKKPSACTNVKKEGGKAKHIDWSKIKEPLSLRGEIIDY